VPTDRSPLLHRIIKASTSARLLCLFTLLVDSVIITYRHIGGADGNDPRPTEVICRV
jgi:hypothetical protein